MKAFKICTLIVILGYLIHMPSCKPAKNEQNISVDTSDVIEMGIDYIFKTNKFAPSFYAFPVKIVDSNNIPHHFNFIFNGKEAERVAPMTREEYAGNLESPLPYVKVNKISIDSDQKIQLELEFPSIGTIYELEIVKTTEMRKRIAKFRYSQY